MRDTQHGGTAEGEAVGGGCGEPLKLEMTTCARLRQGRPKNKENLGKASGEAAQPREPGPKTVQTVGC